MTADGSRSPGHPPAGDDPTKADDLALRIEADIVEGRLPPGTVLRQDRLSAQYGVSRTPVREALRRLEALGLVAHRPNRGALVVGLGEGELTELFAIRASLEALAAETAAQRITDAELESLRAHAREFETLTAQLCAIADPADGHVIASRWIESNNAFHDVILTAAGMPTLERLTHGVRRVFSGQFIARSGGELAEQYHDNVLQHTAVLEALTARSGAGAGALMREHVLRSGRLLAAVIELAAETP